MPLGGVATTPRPAGSRVFLVPYTGAVVPMPVPNPHPTTPEETRWLFRPAMNPR